MIEYVTGDATYPRGDGLKFLVHVCNDIGVWGAGFVLAINKRWGAFPYKQYKRVGKTPLGSVHFFNVESDIVLCNMIAQRGLRSPSNRIPLQYDMLHICLVAVKDEYEFNKATGGIHMPRIGCGLAGGKWPLVCDIVERTLDDIPVTVYDLP